MEGEDSFWFDNTRGDLRNPNQGRLTTTTPLWILIKGLPPLTLTLKGEAEDTFIVDLAVGLSTV
jgi:hypothetical protein